MCPVYVLCLCVGSCRPPVPLWPCSLSKTSVWVCNDSTVFSSCGTAMIELAFDMMVLSLRDSTVVLSRPCVVLEGLLIWSDRLMIQLVLACLLICIIYYSAFFSSHKPAAAVSLVVVICGECGDLVRWPTNTYLTLPTTPKICCHTTMRNCGIRIMLLQTSLQC